MDEEDLWVTIDVACFDEPDPAIWAKIEWIRATYWRGAAIAESPLAAIVPLLARPLACVLQLRWLYVATNAQGQEVSVDWCLKRIHGLRFWSQMDAPRWGPGTALGFENPRALVDPAALARACADGSTLARQLDALLRNPNPRWYAGA